MEQKIQRSPGMPWGSIASLFAAIFYGVSPIDLIPDVILVLGWVDDAIAVPMFLVFAGVLYSRHRKAGKTRAKQSAADIISAEPVIPQRYESGTH